MYFLMYFPDVFADLIYSKEVKMVSVTLQCYMETFTPTLSIYYVVYIM